MSQPHSLIPRDGTTPARFLSRVIGTINPGTVTVLVGPGVNLLEGGVEHEIPVELIPRDLRKPNCTFWIHFVNNHPIIERLESRQSDVYAENTRRWFQIHLSTAVVMMVSAGIVLKLNMLPVWHYAGEEGGVELFEITGYGWPFKWYETGLFYGMSHPASFSLVKVGCNALIGLILVVYFGTLAEWPTLPKHVARGLMAGNVFGLILGLLCFACQTVSAFGPVFSEVSFSIASKPWWQNWRSGLIVFLFVSPVVGAIVGIRTYFLQSERGNSI